MFYTNNVVIIQYTTVQMLQIHMLCTNNVIIMSNDTIYNIVNVTDIQFMYE